MNYKNIKSLFFLIGIFFSFSLAAQISKRDTTTTIIVNEKYSIIDIKGNYLIKESDKEIAYIPETNYYAVITDNRIGINDLKDKVIIPPALPSLYLIKDVFIGKSKNNNIFFYDIQGTLLFFLDGRNYQLPLLYGYFSENFIPVQYKEKFGYLNKQGKKVIDFEYDEARTFKNGYAIVGEEKEGRMKYGLINLKNKITIPIKYDKIEPEGNSSYIVGIEQSRKSPSKIHYKHGLINTHNDITIPVIYDTLIRQRYGGSYSTSRFFLAYDKKTKWKLVDSENNVKLCCYESMTELNGGILVAKDKNWGVVDTSGNVIIPFTYDEITLPDSNVIAIKKDNKWGIVRTDGSPLTDLVYDNTPRFSYGLALMKSEGRYQIINYEGKIIMDDVPTEEWYTEENVCTLWPPFQSPTVFTFYSDGKFGLMDLDKNIVFPAIVDSCLDFWPLE